MVHGFWRPRAWRAAWLSQLFGSCCGKIVGSVVVRCRGQRRECFRCWCLGCGFGAVGVSTNRVSSLVGPDVIGSLSDGVLVVAVSASVSSVDAGRSPGPPCAGEAAGAADLPITAPAAVDYATFICRNSSRVTQTSSTQSAAT